MTLDDFMDALSKTPRDWLVTEKGWVRRAWDDRFVGCCPIKAVAGETSLCKASTKLGGLAYETRRQILKAADNDGCHEPALRDRLLAACGLPQRQRTQP